jgi:8-oxo-dGTP diphosphatase
VQIPPITKLAGQPRTGVSILLRAGGKVLLVKRAHEPFAGCWSLPGGSQELGETLEEAARRELAEETGLTARQLAFAEIVEPMMRAHDGTVLRHFVLALFVGDAFEGQLLAGDDASAVDWFGLEAMDGLEMTPGTAQIVRRLARA